MRINFYDMQDKELFKFEISDNVPAWVVFNMAQSLLGKKIELDPGSSYTIGYAKSPHFSDIRVFKMLEDKASS